MRNFQRGSIFQRSLSVPVPSFISSPSHRVLHKPGNGVTLLSQQVNVNCQKGAGKDGVEGERERGKKEEWVHNEEGA